MLDIIVQWDEMGQFLFFIFIALLLMVFALLGIVSVGCAGIEALTWLFSKKK